MYVKPNDIPASIASGILLPLGRQGFCKFMNLILHGGGSYPKAWRTCETTTRGAGSGGSHLSVKREQIDPEVRQTSHDAL